MCQALARSNLYRGSVCIPLDELHSIEKPMRPLIKLDMLKHRCPSSNSTSIRSYSQAIGGEGPEETRQQGYRGLYPAEDDASWVLKIQARSQAGLNFTQKMHINDMAILTL